MLSVRSGKARRLNAGVRLESGEGKEKAVILEPFLGGRRGQESSRFLSVRTEPLSPPQNSPVMVTPNRMAFRSGAFGR